MAKQIAGFIEPKSKLLAPVYTYEVDTGSGKVLLIEANRVDQIGEAIIFMIEYNDYNIHVAGFAKWKSFRLLKAKETPTPEKKDPGGDAELPLPKKKRVKSQPQLQFY
jgi:hypothetical protein